MMMTREIGRECRFAIVYDMMGSKRTGMGYNQQKILHKIHKK